MRGASSKNAETWAWETYRPQQSFMSSTFSIMALSQPEFWQCRIALPFFKKDTPQTHKNLMKRMLSLLYGSMDLDILTFSSSAWYPSKRERVVVDLLSIPCFFKWTWMLLSSNWMVTLLLQCRQQRPNGEKVNSGCDGASANWPFHSIVVGCFLLMDWFKLSKMKRG